MLTLSRVRISVKLPVFVAVLCALAVVFLGLFSVVSVDKAAV